MISSRITAGVLIGWIRRLLSKYDWLWQNCYKVFVRKGWRSSTGVERKVWQCSERYKVKGIMGCNNHYVVEITLEKAYMMAWNALATNRECFLEGWQLQRQSENLLASYRAEKFMEYTDKGSS